ncbi:MAG TPA: helix-turn-helix transcriptional regulator [Nitrospiraceae bacterium]|nr:helix-turn-helix transcriptional regulator [Nitrospiraceae bacterium]
MKLRRLRIQKRLRQVDLAKKAKVSQGLISQLETQEKSGPNVRTLLRIARVLGVSIEELVRP